MPQVNIVEWLIAQGSSDIRVYVTNNEAVFAHVKTQQAAPQTAQSDEVTPEVAASPGTRPAANADRADAENTESEGTLFDWLQTLPVKAAESVVAVGSTMLWAARARVYDLNRTAEKVRIARDFLGKLDQRLANSRLLVSEDSKMNSNLTDLLNGFSTISDEAITDASELLRKPDGGVEDPGSYDETLNVFSGLLSVVKREPFIKLLTIVLLCEKSHSNLQPQAAAVTSGKKKGSTPAIEVNNRCIKETQELITQLMQWVITLRLDEQRAKNVKGYTRMVPHALAEGLAVDLEQAIIELNNFNLGIGDATQRHDNYVTVVNSLRSSCSARNNAMSGDSNQFANDIDIDLHGRYREARKVQHLRQRHVA